MLYFEQTHNMSRSILSVTHQNDVTDTSIKINKITYKLVNTEGNDSISGIKKDTIVNMTDKIYHQLYTDMYSYYSYAASLLLFVAARLWLLIVLLIADNILAAMVAYKKKQPWRYDKMITGIVFKVLMYMVCLIIILASKSIFHFEDYVADILFATILTPEFKSIDSKIFKLTGVSIFYALSNKIKSVLSNMAPDNNLEDTEDDVITKPSPKNKRTNKN